MIHIDCNFKLQSTRLAYSATREAASSRSRPATLGTPSPCRPTQPSALTRRALLHRCLRAIPGKHLRVASRLGAAGQVRYWLQSATGCHHSTFEQGESIISLTVRFKWARFSATGCVSFSYYISDLELTHDDSDENPFRMVVDCEASSDYCDFYSSFVVSLEVVIVYCSWYT